jgi:hypothetical protein
MSTVCGHCLRRIPARYFPFIIWCSDEKFYVCSRCWREICKEGHGKGIGNKGDHPMVNLLFILLIFSMVLPIGLFGISDIILRTEWDNLKQVDIAELPESGYVRLEGVISGEPDEVAITGYETEGRYSYTWNWNNDDEFLLNDSTGSVKISTEKFYEIEPGPHHAPNADHSKGTAYITNDSAILIGEVVVENGKYTVYLLWISTDEPNFTIPVTSYLAAFSVMGFFIFFLLIVLWLAVTRSIYHRRRVRYKNPITIRRTVQTRDLELDWKKNIRFNQKRRIVIASIMVVFGWLILFVLLFTYIHTVDHFLFVLVIQMLTTPGLIILPIWFFFRKDILKADEVAFTDKGVHFYFSNHIFRYLRSEYITWDDVKDVYFRRSGKGGMWVIEKKDGTAEDFGTLHPENFVLIRSIWKKIKDKKQVIKRKKVYVR